LVCSTLWSSCLSCSVYWVHPLTIRLVGLTELLILLEVSFGLFHALVFLPVLLSVLGPPSHHQVSRLHKVSHFSGDGVGLFHTLVFLPVLLSILGLLSHHQVSRLHKVSNLPSVGVWSVLQNLHPGLPAFPAQCTGSILSSSEDLTKLVILLVVVFGLFHTLVFLPVLLSVLGPLSTLSS
jgi:hypothetical protein